MLVVFDSPPEAPLIDMFGKNHESNDVMLQGSKGSDLSGNMEKPTNQLTYGILAEHFFFFIFLHLKTATATAATTTKNQKKRELNSSINLFSLPVFHFSPRFTSTQLSDRRSHWNAMFISNKFRFGAHAEVPPYAHTITLCITIHIFQLFRSWNFFYLFCHPLVVLLWF